MNRQGKTPDTHAQRGAGYIGAYPESNPNLHSMPELQNSTDRALVASSAWLDVGFVGAAALAVGLLQMFDPEPNWPWVLVMAFSGGVLAAASWRRGRIGLEHAGRTPAVATDAPGEPASRPFQADWARHDSRVDPRSAATEPQALS